MNEGNPIPKLEDIPHLEMMYRQHWEHSRHCEEQIFWFTSIYAAVVAAIFYIIAEMSKIPEPDFSLILVFVSFGLILSVFGFMVVVAQSLGHHNYIMNIVTICYRWNVLEFYANPKKPVYYKRVHRWFFEITIALFIVFSLVYGYRAWTAGPLFHEHRIWLIVVFIIIPFVIEGLYLLRWRKYSNERNDFKKTLRNDTEGIYRKDWDKWFRDPSFPEFWKKIVKDAKERKEKEAEERKEKAGN